VRAELELGGQPLLERVQAQVSKPAACGIGEGFVAELGERRPPPECERLPQQL
jgi:hypothetical protein